MPRILFVIFLFASYILSACSSDPSQSDVTFCGGVPQSYTQSYASAGEDLIFTDGEDDSVDLVNDTLAVSSSYDAPESVELVSHVTFSSSVSDSMTLSLTEAIGGEETVMALSDIPYSDCDEDCVDTIANLGGITVTPGAFISGAWDATFPSVNDYASGVSLTMNYTNGAGETRLLTLTLSLGRFSYTISSANSFTCSLDCEDQESSFVNNECSEGNRDCSYSCDNGLSGSFTYDPDCVGTATSDSGELMSILRSSGLACTGLTYSPSLDDRTIEVEVN